MLEDIWGDLLPLERPSEQVQETNLWEEGGAG